MSEGESEAAVTVVDGGHLGVCHPGSWALLSCDITASAETAGGDGGGARLCNTCVGNVDINRA